MTSAQRIARWRDAGEYVRIAGRDVFVRVVPGAEPTVVLLHGYPSSSYDWRGLIGEVPNRLVLFDFLGFGLSDKPRNHVYSLFQQADLVEEVMARHVPDASAVLVAHDMGTSVATELLARGLGNDVLLFNGSMVVEKASLTLGQKVLRGRLGPVVARLTTRIAFLAQFRRVFTSAYPLSRDEAEDQWALLSYNDGHKILDKLIYYLHERVAQAPRWHGALRDWPGRLELAWAGRDPVCTEAVLQAVLALRPGAPVVRLPELGHYPQLDDPEAVAGVVAEFAAKAG